MDTFIILWKVSKPWTWASYEQKENSFFTLKEAMEFYRVVIGFPLNFDVKLQHVLPSGDIKID